MERCTSYLNSIDCTGITHYPLAAYDELVSIQMPGTWWKISLSLSLSLSLSVCFCVCFCVSVRTMVRERERERERDRMVSVDERWCVIARVCEYIYMCVMMIYMYSYFICMYSMQVPVTRISIDSFTKVD